MKKRKEGYIFERGEWHYVLKVNKEKLREESRTELGECQTTSKVTGFQV